MHTTNLKLDVKKKELDMALDDETRILKQSFCALIYGLIKRFSYPFPIRSFQSFLNAIPQLQKQILLSTTNGRRPHAWKKKRTSKYKVTDSFETHSLTH